MNKEVGGRIAKEIGELVTVDVPRNGLAWGRIRVNMDITKPLMRGKIMRIEGWRLDGFISNMRDFQFSVMGVLFSVTMIVSAPKDEWVDFLWKRMIYDMVIG